MLVCKKSMDRNGQPRNLTAGPLDRIGGARSGLGDGGPVFLPRRKPSAIAQSLLAPFGASEPEAASGDLDRSDG